jgi:hypothetical protein
MKERTMRATRQMGILLVVTPLMGLKWVGPVERAPNRAAVDPPSFILQWGSGGSGTGEFLSPRAIAISSAGRVYVGDTMNDRVQ